MDIKIKDQNGEHAIDSFFIDEPCVVSFFVGELGWLVQRWQGYLRHLKHNVYKDHKFFVMLNGQYHVLVQDFVNWTVDLPEDFYKLRLETDCYEAPLAGSPAGALTPSNVWSSLIGYMRQFYNPEKAVEVWTPRGVNTWIDMQPQLFIKYTTEALLQSDRPIITVFPRGRSRASFRNVPEYVWVDVVENLRQYYNVVLCGTPSGSYLVNYQAPGVDNLIGKANLEKVLHLLNNSVCSISSQSGPTHLSVLSMCPSYIIGHEQQRHAVDDNRFTTPTSFRFVQDYRAIDAPTIVNDVFEFIRALQKHDEFNSISRRTLKPMTRCLTTEGRRNVVGAILNYNNIANVGNIANLVDLDKLYLVGPMPTGNALTELTSRLAEYNKTDKIHWITEPVNEALNFLPDDLDFVYADSFLPAALCEDYFYKLKAGGLFGSGNKTEWIKFGWPLVYRRVYEGTECDIHSRYTKGLPLEGWYVRMGGLLRESFRNLIGKKNLVGAEIGVYYGENSKAILENLSIKKLYLIDPYSKGLVGIEQDGAPEQILKGAKRLLQKHQDKIMWVRKSSQDALEDIKEQLDFVYIDGDHSYMGAKLDFQNYWPLIKEGGILAGHDFDNKDVERAAHEFFDANEPNAIIFTGMDIDGTVEFWVYKVPNLAQQVVSEDIQALDNLLKIRDNDARLLSR